MSESAAGPSLSVPSVAHGPAGCAAVAAGSRDTALAAAAVLRAGGNAVDAALAAPLPPASLKSSSRRWGRGFPARASARRQARGVGLLRQHPGLGDRPAQADPEFTPVTVRYPGTEQIFHVGPGSVAVPGALAGLFEAHSRHGRLPFSQLVQPAIDLARHGAVLEPVQAVVLDLVREIMSLTDECARLISTPHGHAVARRPAAEPGLRRVPGTDRRRDRDVAVVACLRRAVVDLMGHTSGHVTPDDLAGYRVARRDPILVERNGSTISLNAPPAFGG